MLPSEIEKELLSCILPHLKGGGPAEILLFGSFAKKTQKTTSDIDIAIKAKTPLDLARWAEMESALEESSISRKVDIIDYHRVSTEFQRLIDKEGIILKQTS